MSLFVGVVALQEVEVGRAPCETEALKTDAGCMYDGVMTAVVLEQTAPGKHPVDLCKLGDTTIEEKLSKIFSKKVRAEPHGVELSCPRSLAPCVTDSLMCVTAGSSRDAGEGPHH